MAKLLDIGTELFFLEESKTDRWFSRDPYHFEVTHGTITRINAGGYKEYVVPTINRLGRQTSLIYAKTSELGKTFWMTYEEAVEAAEKATENYETRWGRICKDLVPMMRPWREDEEQTERPEQHPV